MGNKQSSEHRSSDPTSRSFSWQPDPLFVHAFPPPDAPFNHPPPKRYDPAEFPPADPSQKSPKERSRNGSVILDEAVFGGVHPMPPHFSKQARKPESENSVSPPRGGSRPGTSDSGYFTGVDSADAKLRNRLRGSRLSLNEAVFDGQHSPSGPPFHPPFPPPPHMYPPPHLRMMPPPPMDPYFRPGPAHDFDSKKGKKWRKKKKGKITKWNSAHMPPPDQMFPPPPPPPHRMAFRAQSVDNFGDMGLLPPPPGGPAFFPPDVRRRFGGSQMDLAPPWMRPPPFQPPSQFTPEPRVGGKRKEKKGKVLTPGSEQLSVSSSSKGSRRTREATHFEEERLSIQNFRPPPSRSSKEVENQALYESLRGQLGPRSERTSVVATAEVTAEAGPPSEDEAKDPLPLKISAEARAVLERNERILGLATENPPSEDLRQPPKIVETPKPRKGDDEEIVAIRRPILLPRKKPKSKDFEPLDLWRAINVEAAVRERQPSRGNHQQLVVEEKISVRLTPVLPSRCETQGEPIYLEYDEKLPEFKKRLIETGSFDFPGKLHHLDPDEAGPTSSSSKTKSSAPSQPPQSSGDGYLAERKEGSGKEKSEKGSLRRLKDSVSHMFNHRSKSTEREEWKRKAPNGGPDSRYLSSGSLTPRGAESSEIDFSWVNDLETKFRMDEFGGGEKAPPLDASLRKGFESHCRAGMAEPPSRYFGMTVDTRKPSGLIGSSSYQVSHQSKAERESELVQLNSKVRLKAAMFEQEAAKIHPPPKEEPRPDRGRDQQFLQTNNQHRGSNGQQHYDAKTLEQKAAGLEEAYLSNSLRSPSERKIHRLEQQRKDYKDPTSTLMPPPKFSPDRNSAGPKFSPDSRLAPYHNHPGPPANNRVYNATEFYRHNFQEGRSNGAVYASQPVLQNGRGYRKAENGFRNGGPYQSSEWY